ncbi:hypothetical protein MPSEU_001036500 [Mayamaea pseudoterrestris]|nr:hypothetical protein MPSEU_001036500 [Mayamaea pseudoterrestris]
MSRLHYKITLYIWLLLRAASQAFGWCQLHQQQLRSSSSFQLVSTRNLPSSARINAVNWNAERSEPYTDCESICECSRRSFFGFAFIASSMTMIPCQAIAAASTADGNPPLAARDESNGSLNDDAYTLDAMKSLHSDGGGSKWPHTPSPLPKPTNGTTSSLFGDEIGSSSLAPSDLQQALEQAKRKRNVGPLTHGI